MEKILRADQTHPLPKNAKDGPPCASKSRQTLKCLPCHLTNGSEPWVSRRAEELRNFDKRRNKGPSLTDGSEPRSLREAKTRQIRQRKKQGWPILCAFCKGWVRLLALPSHKISPPRQPESVHYVQSHKKRNYSTASLANCSPAEPAPDSHACSPASPAASPPSRH